MTRSASLEWMAPDTTPERAEERVLIVQNQLMNSHFTLFKAPWAIWASFFKQTGFGEQAKINSQKISKIYHGQTVYRANDDISKDL